MTSLILRTVGRYEKIKYLVVTFPHPNFGEKKNFPIFFLKISNYNGNENTIFVIFLVKGFQIFPCVFWCY